MTVRPSGFFHPDAQKKTDGDNNRDEDKDKLARGGPGEIADEQEFVLYHVEHRRFQTLQVRKWQLDPVTLRIGNHGRNRFRGYLWKGNECLPDKVTKAIESSQKDHEK